MKKIYEKIKCPICKEKNFSVLKKNQNPDLSLKQIKKYYLSSSDNIMSDQLSKCIEETEIREIPKKRDLL